MNGWKLHRLPTGSLVPDVLIEMATTHRWQSAVCAGIGGVTDVELAYYNLAMRSYRPFQIPGIVELVSLNGNLTGPEGEPFWHLHAVVADAEGRCWAGHVNHFRVALTVELAVWPSSHIYIREFDDNLGLRLLRS